MSTAHTQTVVRHKSNSMKKKILFTCLIMSVNYLSSQQTSVEKSIFGIQAGFGIWAHNEFRLSDDIAFRTEIGFDGAIWDGMYYESTGFLLAPSISIEPRWYYNFEKRASKDKRTDGNSANFLTLKFWYHPDWFVISNQDVTSVSDFSIIPTWGIRRNLGQHFNFETGVGLGYTWFFAEAAGYPENDSQTTLAIHLRIGYKFKPKR